MKSLCLGAALVAAMILFVPAFAAEPGAMVPFPIDWDRGSESVIDLSRFLDAPAGAEGFLRMEGNRIVRPDGKRFRVWGVNICSADSFPPKDEAPKIAADLARYGINCVRFHHMDSRWGFIFAPDRNDTRRLDPEKLDRLDYFVAELKKRGIYTNLNLNVSRPYKAGDLVRDFEILGYGKGATYYNDRLVMLQKEYARQLLTHYNPYTGNDYRNEPAVAVVELVNENSLMESWINYRLIGEENIENPGTWSHLPLSYTEELTEKYNDWLKAHKTPEELARIRKETNVGEDELIPRLKPGEFPKASRERFHAEATFIMEIEHNYFEEMKRLLRDEIGVRSILVGSGDHNDGISGYPHIRANMILDVIDGHGYWQHPRMQGEFRMQNTPMVNDPFDSTVVQFARTPVMGRPFTISETNHPYPNEYTCEGFPILTAYTLLHDWDGIYWFAFGYPRKATRDKARLRPFDFGNDPMKMAEVAACGLMFHRQDLKAAEQMIVRAYTEENIIESIRLPRDERPFFTPGFARSTPLIHATRSTFDGVSTMLFPEPVTGPVIESDTGQIAWYHDESETGLITVESDRTQALIGFVGPRDKAVKNLAESMDSEFACLLCTSLDGRPIDEASQLLLVTGTKVADTGLQLTEDRKGVEEWGAYPPAIEPLEGAVILRNLDNAKSIEVQPLTAEGRPMDETIAAERTGEGWSIPLGDPVTVWYRVIVKR